MASQRFCPSCLASVPSPQSFSGRATRVVRPAFAALQSQYTQRRAASRQGGKTAAATKMKKAKKEMWVPDLSQLPQYSLMDAMRYIRATEVGQKPYSAKYELHIRLKTIKSGPVLRGTLRLPHAVNTADRICVIADPESQAGKQAIAAGAYLVGEETVFEAVRAGKIDFEKCIAHPDSMSKLAKANLGRILGPRGLMPSAKLGTVAKNITQAVQNAQGGTEYRERMGVVRVGIGQLAYTPVELQHNIKAFINKLKKDISELSDNFTKSIHEVVLSSTRGPGISLNGALSSSDSPDVRDLSTVS